MELHSKVAQLYDEIRAKDELAVCIGRDSALVSPLLRLVINGVQINVFGSSPAGSTKYHWLIGRVIVLVSPSASRVEKSHAQQLVVCVHAARDQDFLVA
jgi:hypothetical protein